MRKIIQIALDMNNKIVALCDDGSVWIKFDGWKEIHTDEIYSDEDEKVDFT